MTEAQKEYGFAAQALGSSLQKANLGTNRRLSSEQAQASLVELILPKNKETPLYNAVAEKV